MMDFLASDLEQYSHVAAELDAKLSNIIESSKSLQHRMLPVNRNVTHLQTRRQNIEVCLEALSKAQDYHNTGKKVDKIIHDGPSNNLEEYLPAIDSLQEALSYFQQNNPEHVEYTHLKSLFETAAHALDGEFLSELRRYTYPVDSEHLKKLIDLESEGKEDLNLEDLVFGSRQREMANSRRIAEWLRSRECNEYLTQYSTVRRENVVKSLANLKEYINSCPPEGLTGSPSVRRKLGRMDLSRPTMKRRTCTNPSADFVVSLQQRRPSKKGALHLLKETHAHKRQGSTDLREDSEEFDVTAFTYQIYAMLKLLRHEANLLSCLRLASNDANAQRQTFDHISLHTLMHLLSESDVLSRILTRSIVKHEFSCILSLFAVLKLYAEVKEEMDKILAKSSEKTKMMFSKHVSKLKAMANRNLETYNEFIRSGNDKSSVLPRDGNVHELTVNTLMFLENLHDFGNLIGAVIISEQCQSSELPGDKAKCRALGEFISKAIKSLKDNIVRKAEGYGDECLRQVFVINNIHFIDVYITKNAMKQTTYQWNYQIDDFFRQSTDQAQQRYIQHLERALRSISSVGEIEVNLEKEGGKMDSKQKDLIKDMWEGFNNQFAALYKNNRQYIIQDQTLRERMVAEVRKTIVPKYAKFYDCYITLPFSSKKGKYIKHSVAQIESMIGQFFTGDTTV